MPDLFPGWCRYVKQSLCGLDHDDERTDASINKRGIIGYQCQSRTPDSSNASTRRDGVPIPKIRPP